MDFEEQRGTFSPVYQQSAPGNGIGGYDLQSTADRAFAFDYDGSGKLDHLALYRPGTGQHMDFEEQRGNVLTRLSAECSWQGHRRL